MALSLVSEVSSMRLLGKAVSLGAGLNVLGSMGVGSPNSVVITVFLQLLHLEIQDEFAVCTRHQQWAHAGVPRLPLWRRPRTRLTIAFFQSPASVLCVGDAAFIGRSQHFGVGKLDCSKLLNCAPATRAFHIFESSWEDTECAHFPHRPCDCNTHIDANTVCLQLSASPSCRAIWVLGLSGFKVLGARFWAYAAFSVYCTPGGILNVTTKNRRRFENFTKLTDRQIDGAAEKVRTQNS